MNYPIIHILSNDPTVYGNRKGPELAAVALLDNFKQSLIYDSSGRKYIIESAKIVGWKYFFGYSPLFKGRTAKIEYIFSSTQELDLNSFKNEIVQQLNKGVSKGMPYSKKDIPKLQDSIKKTENYKEIIELFLYDLI